MPRKGSSCVSRAESGGDGQTATTTTAAAPDKVVLEVGGMLRASEKAVVEAAIGRRPGVLEVEANPVSQTATVTFDPAGTSLADLRRWVTECGYHCAGQSVPDHVCDPMLLAGAAPAGVPESGAGETMPTPHEAMGHGGHEGMSMDSMVRDMRNRFLVAALFSIPIVLWSPIGSDVFGFDVAPPFGLREDVLALILSLPVILYP
ncbi:MAG: hypothetical protein F9K43_30245, partial [Bauldia sp.]